MTKTVMALVAAGTILILGSARDGHSHAPPGTTHDSVMAASQAGVAAGASGLAASVPSDARFIAAMVPHHQAAISMSKEALDKGEHAEILAAQENMCMSKLHHVRSNGSHRDTWPETLELVPLQFQARWLASRALILP